MVNFWKRGDPYHRELSEYTHIISNIIKYFYIVVVRVPLFVLEQHKHFRTSFVRFRPAINTFSCVVNTFSCVINTFSCVLNTFSCIFSKVTFSWTGQFPFQSLFLKTFLSSFQEIGTLIWAVIVTTSIGYWLMLYFTTW